MPESRYRYLYERLGDHDFQQLVSALLADQFPNFIPLALRQADGGRDGLRKLDARKVLVYQVKWSVSGKEKDPVTWLDQVVKSEMGNLRRLAGEGVRNYILVTNVASTGLAMMNRSCEVRRRVPFGGSGGSGFLGGRVMKSVWCCIRRPSARFQLPLMRACYPSP